MTNRLLLLLMTCTAVWAQAEDLIVSNIKNFGHEDSFSIRISNGEIVEIGELSLEEANVIDGGGGYVTPGYIDSGSTFGIEEVGLGTRTEDQQYDGEAMGAGFNPVLAYHAGSSIAPSLLAEGVTHVFLKPGMGKDVFAGQGALVSLSGRTVPGKSTAVFAYLGERGRENAGNSRAAALQRLLLGLEEAELFVRKRRAYESGSLRDLAFSYQDLVVLADVITGQKKLIIYVDRASEIESVLSELEIFDINIVLMGAREAWKVTEAIVASNTPVILNALDNLPLSFDRLGARLDQPKLLQEAGITFAFMTEDLYSNTRMLSQAAGVAVSYGLPWQDALNAITLNPALIWGEEGLGSIEVGKNATFAVWDGDPLEVTSKTTLIVIDGKLINRTNRQDLLKERYQSVGKGSTPYVYR